MARLRAPSPHLVRRAAASSVAVVLLVAAVSTGASAQPAAWRTHAIARTGSIALPSTWRDFMQKRGLNSAIQRASARNPKVRPLLYALTVPMGSLVRFVAADLARRSLATGYVTDLIVLVQRSSVRLDSWGVRMLNALRRSPIVVGAVHRGSLRLSAGRALTFRSVQRVQAGDRFRRGAVVQYAVARNGSIYLLTFTTTPAQLRAYAPVFDESARSLRLK